MDTERAVTRIVESWLRTDEHESADRVLDTVIALLDTTPQRRSWWPAPRSANMNTYAKLALAAVAVVVVAVIGLSLRTPGGGVGDGGTTSTPSPSPSQAVAASPSPTPVVVFPPAGNLAVGTRHHMTLEGVPFTFTVPTSGWTSNGSFSIVNSGGESADGAGFIFWGDAPVGTFADPCADKKGPPVGPSVAALAAVVAAVPGTQLVSGPTDVTVGGYPAKHVVITVPEDIGCAAPNFMLWYAPDPELARYASAKGSTIEVWIVDVDGRTVWIDGETYKGAEPARAEELQKLIDSIRFD